MTQEDRERALMEKGREIIRRDFDNPESKLRKMMQDVIVERIGKLVLRDTWPELFGDWTDEQVKKSTGKEMWDKVHRFLMTGTGVCKAFEQQQAERRQKFPDHVIAGILNRAVADPE